MRKMFSRVRFLPLTIFAATLMLTVKLGDIWQGLGQALDVAEAQAQISQPATGMPAPAANSPAGQAPAAANAGTGTAAPASGSTKPAAGAAMSKAAGKGGKTAADRLIVDDPTLLSPAEIEILQRLAARRDALDKRQRELDMREGLLKAAEQRINGKIQELKQLQGTIEQLTKKYDKHQEEKLARLVKIYQTMKPKDAARIFEKLDMSTLLDVAERMKERKLAPIMAAMDPKRAREVTVDLERRRQLPKAGSPFPLAAGG